MLCSGSDGNASLPIADLCGETIIRICRPSCRWRPCCLFPEFRRVRLIDIVIIIIIGRAPCHVARSNATTDDDDGETACLLDDSSRYQLSSTRANLSTPRLESPVERPYRRHLHRIAATAAEVVVDGKTAVVSSCAVDVQHTVRAAASDSLNERKVRTLIVNLRLLYIYIHRPQENYETAAAVIGRV